MKAAASPRIYIGRCPKVACDWGLSRIVISSVSENSFLLSPSLGRGTPEGQGVGRRRNRAKPTSGATRHLLPKEGGRSGMSSPSTPFPWKGVDGQGVGRRRNRAKPTSGAARHLLPKEGGRNRSKCIALYTSSLKAGYSYSLFMKLHRLNGF